MNILAVKTLMDTVSPELGFEYAEDFGFNTLYREKDVNGSVFTDISPSLALGGLTDGVTNLQLTAAYATIANQGIYQKPILYTKILDRSGQVLIDNVPDSHQVVQASTAFLLTDAMSQSMQPSSLFGLHSSTSTIAALDYMPAAGKSGTTTGKTDLWFVGFTPYLTMGIWTGFDDQTTMEANESSSYHKVIWKKIMDRINVKERYFAKNFQVPRDIVQVEICAKSGKLAKSTCKGDHREGMVYTEYFKRGTEPTEECDLHYSMRVCSSSGMKPNQWCPKTYYKTCIKLPENTTGSTDDSSHTAGKATRTCTVHKAPEPVLPPLDSEIGTDKDKKKDKKKTDEETPRG